LLQTWVWNSVSFSRPETSVLLRGFKKAVEKSLSGFRWTKKGWKAWAISSATGVPSRKECFFWTTNTCVLRATNIGKPRTWSLGGTPNRTTTKAGLGIETLASVPRRKSCPNQFPNERRCSFGRATQKQRDRVARSRNGF
jgi:hypothetical protein